MREHFQYQIQELKDRYERSLQEKTNSDLQHTANLKNDIAVTMQRITQEEQRRKKENEELFHKLKQQLIHNHGMEIEKLKDHHRYEIKHIQAQYESQYQESIYKLKHIHEQELNRQIRENDRLQRLLARQGVTSSIVAEGGNFASTVAFDGNSSRIKETPIYHNLTPGKTLERKSENERSERKDLSKKDPQETEKTKAEKTSPVLSSSKFNWGFLEKSLKAQVVSSIQCLFSSKNSFILLLLQDDGKYVSGSKFSTAHLPPDPFPLNEALEGVKHQRKNHLPQEIGISTNSKKMTSYLKQLENYLDGQDISSDSPTDLLEMESEDQLEKKNLLYSHHLNQRSDNETEETDSLDEGMNLTDLAQLPLEISSSSNLYYYNQSSVASSGDSIVENRKS
jgi:hypothetical protein